MKLEMTMKKLLTITVLFLAGCVPVGALIAHVAYIVEDEIERLDVMDAGVDASLDERVPEDL